MEIKIPNNPTPKNSSPDHSLVKIIILAFLGAAFAFGFSFFLKIFIDSPDWVSGIIILSVMAGFLVMFLLQVFFLGSKTLNALVLLAQSLLFLAGFYDKFSIPIFWAAILLFLILFWGSYSGISELEILSKIKFWRIGKKALPKAIFAVTLFGSVAYYGYFKESAVLKPDEFIISETTFEKAVNPVVPLIQKMFPEFDLSLTAEEFLNKVASSQANKNDQFKKLPDALKKPAISQIAKESEKRIEEMAGISIDPKARVSKALYGAMVKKFTDLPVQIRDATPLFAAAIIFLTIISMSFFIRWIVSLIAYLFYEILLALGFAAIMLQGGSKEVIVLSKTDSQNLINY